MLSRFRLTAIALSISLLTGTASADDFSSDDPGWDDTAENGGNVIDGNDTLTISSSGQLSNTGDNARAVNLSGGSNTFISAGTVSAVGRLSRGVYVEDSNNILDVSGNISSSGPSSTGIYILGGTNNRLTFDGVLTAAEGYGIITTGIGSSSSLLISGRIQTENGIGVLLQSSNHILEVSGTIDVGGALAIEIDGSQNNVILSGNIFARDIGAAALYVYETAGVRTGDNNTISFREGVRVVGDIILIDGNDTTGNTLKFDVGSTMSYVYDTTGSWTLEDLDGRAVVEGSAMAAGIGNAETADELQYLRLSQLNNSLLNRADRYALVDDERQAWVDPFYFQSDRDASSSDATIEDYDADGYGLTVGLPVVLKGLDADVILGVQETELNIHSGTQTIDVTSLRAGLYFPNLLTKDAIRVSGKALIGYNQHDMDRQVLVNTNTTTGITTYTADYDSWEAIAGLEAEHSQAIGSGVTTLTASLGADLVYEAIESYDETANFYWDSRDLLQGVAKASIGLHHVHTNGMKTYAIASVQARDVLDGKTTYYAINGTAVNFNGGDYNDTIAQLNLGATYQAKDNLQLGFNLHAASSDNNIDSYAASARMNWKF